jgi:hypothetical protein
MLHSAVAIRVRLARVIDPFNSFCGVFCGVGGFVNANAFNFALASKEAGKADSVMFPVLVDFYFGSD